MCFLCVLFFSHASFMYLTYVTRPIYFIQHHSQEDTILHLYIGTTKMRGNAHWANEIAVKEHEHVVIKLVSDSDSVFGLRADEISLY